MTANEYTKAIEQLGLSTANAGPALGISRRTSFRYASGAHSIPVPVERLLLSMHRVRRKSNRPEQQIQKAIFQHIAQRGAPSLVAFHVPNGGKRSPIEAAIMKGMGVIPGIPDICCIHGGRAYFIELKVGKNKASDAQNEMHIRLRGAGAEVVTCTGLDEALRQLETWGLLKGEIQ